MHTSFSIIVICILIIAISYWAEYHPLKTSFQLIKQWWFKFVIVAIVLSVGLVCVDIKYGYFGENPSMTDGISNILAEIHGFVFDLILVAIILEFLNRREQTRETQAELEQELEDYQYFDAEEITIRKIRVIKQLIRLNKKDINLSNHIFTKAILGPATFENISLNRVKFNTSTFRRIGFSNSKLRHSHFVKCNFTNVAFQGCDLFHAEFQKCAFSNCSFENCDLSFAELKECRFFSTKFKNCNLEEGSLKDSSVGDGAFDSCRLDNTELDGLLFFDLRRETLAPEIEVWLGKELAQKWIFANYSISNLDDPMPWEQMLTFSASTIRRQKEKNGCVLRKIPDGVTLLDESYGHA